MLDRCGNDPAPRLSEKVRNSEYCLVVSFGSTARKDDLI
jgi:predicted nucleotidyltransferase